MIYSKRWTQKTVREADPAAFDAALNEIYEQAMGATGEQELEVHYFDGMGFCATVRYWTTAEIPETAEERARISGVSHVCADCEHYRPSFDGRVKYASCPHSGRRSGRTLPACELHYQELERRARGVFQSIGRDGQARDLGQAGR